MSLILVGSALVAMIIMGMVAALAVSQQQARKERVLAVIKGKATNTGEKSRDEQDKRRAEIARKLKEQSEEGQKKGNLKASLEQAGMNTTPKKFWLFSALFALGMVIAGALFGLSPFVILMLGITGLLGVPKLFLRRKIRKRQKKFLEEFSDALEAMVRLLKAGMPVSEAIRMAGQEFSGPVGEEMTRIYEAQKVGISLPEAALTATRRMPLTEMQMFATGVTIQQQTGASLSEVLMNLAGVIRARFRLKRKVQALSSEAKASAMIIGALPFLIGGGLFFINPEYIGLLFSTNMGRFMLVGGAIWMSIGVIIMKAMINFKV